jgi:alanyl-tRNA synthetase
MKDAYPELEVQREFIGKMVRLEEERFGNTLTVGLKKLDELFNEKGHTMENDRVMLNIPINDLAKLYDTYGVPIDLMNVAVVDYFKGKGKEIINPVLLDSEKFTGLINDQIKFLQQSSEIGKTKQKETLKPIYSAMERTSVRSNFHGYDLTQVEDANVIALVKNDEQIDELKEGEEGLIILDETPFYAEAGGQVGDTGTLFNQNAQVKVFDTFAPIAGIVLHKSKIEKGSIKVGDTISAMVDAEKRDATRRNHTATHLLHAALREVLGTHVKQAGSVVAPNYLRFDFSHYQGN